MGLAGNEEAPEDEAQRRKYHEYTVSFGYTGSLIIICNIGKFMQLPQGSIRKICTLDDDYRLISKDALIMLTKATEMFIGDLSGTCGDYARKFNRKQMKP